MISEQAFDKLAARTLERIDRAFQQVDPDLVETVVSDGVVQLDFQGRRGRWVVNSQRAARQMWLAAEQKAWHFSHAGEDDATARWVEDRTGAELLSTLARLLKEHAGVDVEL